MVRQGLLAITSIFWPQSSRWPRWTAAGWVIAAAVSVLWYLPSAWRMPDAQEDLFEVRTWVNAWRAGGDPYQIFQGTIDYPPHALVVLRWVGLGGPELAGRIFLLLNVALVVVSCWLLVKWFSRLAEVSLSAVNVITLVAMLLASRGVRESIQWGQTAPLVMALFVLSMLLARRRPWLSGVCFAVASFKLNVAAGFGLALLALGLVQPLVIAGAIVAVLTVVYASSVNQGVMTVLSNYAASLSSVYGGSEFLRGVTGFRSVLIDVTSNAHVAQMSYPVIVGVLLGALLTLVWTQRAVTMRSRAVIVLACVLWSLLSLTHQRYNTVLLFPVVWMLAWSPRPFIRSGWCPQVMATAAILRLTVSLPEAIDLRVTHALAGLPGWWAQATTFCAGVVDEHGTRIVVLSTFAVALRAIFQAGVAGPVPGVVLPDRRGGDERAG